MENKFAKMSSLVDSTFKVLKVDGYKFKKWDTDTSTMSVSDIWKEGFRKLYSVQTEHGMLDISQSQMGNMLEGVSHNGTSDVTGRTFAVKSNGKTGIEIRYFLNPVKEEPKEEAPEVMETFDDPFAGME